MTSKEVEMLIKKKAGKLLLDINVFDVYEGEHVEKGKKSIALHIVYLASDHTLKEEEITEVHNKILSDLNTKLHAELRA